MKTINPNEGRKSRQGQRFGEVGGEIMGTYRFRKL